MPHPAHDFYEKDVSIIIGLQGVITFSKTILAPSMQYTSILSPISPLSGVLPPGIWGTHTEKDIKIITATLLKIVKKNLQAT